MHVCLNCNRRQDNGEKIPDSILKQDVHVIYNNVIELKPKKNDVKVDESAQKNNTKLVLDMAAPRFEIKAE